MKRKDKPPAGFGKPDLLSAVGLESTVIVLGHALSVSKEEIERREAEAKVTNDEARSIA